MQILTFFIIFIAFISSLLLVYYQYFYKVKAYRNLYVLAALRFLAVFAILILLINPTFQRKSYTVLKPKLYVAVDNSASIGFVKQDSSVLSLVDKIKLHKALNEKFDINYFSFGTSLRRNSNFDFQETQTNIYQSLDGLNKLSTKQKSAIILISDGNQTYGNEYQYFISKLPIYSIAIGDTTHFSDLEISQINVNTFANVDNRFPLEVFVNYSGTKNIKSKFVIEENNQVIYSKIIPFSSNKKSEYLQIKLPANKIGKHLYKAKIAPLENEKNIINNLKSFAVEIIDKKTNIAIVYSMLHPDLGMLKRAIESNQKRQVSWIDLNSLENYNMDNDMFILYQPNGKFNKIFKELQSKNKNYFIVTGKNTDWDFLNNIQSDFKKVISPVFENYEAVYNKNFNTFYSEDIGFEDFSPLEDVFGKIEMSVPYQSILIQKINGLQSEDPLLATISNHGERRVLLFGENTWKWRALSYSTTQSFEKFDQFISSLIQFLTINTRNTAIDLTYNSFYYANDIIKIKAKSYDDNLNFDKKANLKLYLNGENNGLPFYLNEGNFEVHLADLKSGDYNFKVVNTNNANQMSGLFTVAKYAVEHELLSTNLNALKMVANNSKGASYFRNEVTDLIDLLIDNQNFTSIQKEYKKNISLIDSWWFISVIILSLSLEWFIRKYRGLI